MQKRRQLGLEMRPYYPVLGKTLVEARDWLREQPSSLLVRRSLEVWFHDRTLPCTLIQDPGKILVRVEGGKIVELIGFES